MRKQPGAAPEMRRWVPRRRAGCQKPGAKLRGAKAQLLPPQQPGASHTAVGERAL